MRALIILCVAMAFCVLSILPDLCACGDKSNKGCV
jgi:hypothetical protein